MGAFDCVSVGNMKATDSTVAIQSSNTTLDQNRRDVESQGESLVKRHNLLWKLSLDLPAITLATLVLVLCEYGVIPTHQAGFYCNDPAISHKYIGDTVPASALIVLGLVLPFVVVFVTEYIFADPTSSFSRKLGISSQKSLKLYACYFYGCFFNIFAFEIMKFVVGNPRPDFMDICEPDAAATCVNSEYVSTFKCTSTRFSSSLIRDSMRSFPSGHTSISVYCSLFTVWYLQRRAFSWRNKAIFLVPLVQMGCLTFGIVSSLTRITDHRHHWWDVLAGTMIGIVTALYVVLGLCKNVRSFKQAHHTNTTNPEQPLYDQHRITLP